MLKIYSAYQSLLYKTKQSHIFQKADFSVRVEKLCYIESSFKVYLPELWIIYIQEIPLFSRPKFNTTPLLRTGRK